MCLSLWLALRTGLQKGWNRCAWVYGWPYALIYWKDGIELPASMVGRTHWSTDTICGVTTWLNGLKWRQAAGADIQLFGKMWIWNAMNIYCCSCKLVLKYSSYRAENTHISTKGKLMPSREVMAVLLCTISWKQTHCVGKIWKF